MSKLPALPVDNYSLKFKNYLNNSSLEFCLDAATRPISKPPEPFQYFYPVLSAPTKNKTGFVCPDDHLEKSKSLLVEADELLVIGWRGTEDHFGEILHDTVGERGIHLTIVTRGSGEETIANLKRYMPNVKEEIFTGGFSEFIKQNKVKSLLTERDSTHLHDCKVLS
ncbi:MAG: hypothetical protein ACD_28C00112G0005 [uncultured bacterium]|nr:MAG: hypothetical protein ACD_28C00112G0005 [uncultured bacterium]KKT74348.1 MAG: hypothetical protein UW70_C0058G0006 [Candidatus Peregrinibacteria bacterium GW2011_GWA2_44_7]